MDTLTLTFSTEIDEKVYVHSKKIVLFYISFTDRMYSWGIRSVDQPCENIFRMQKQNHPQINSSECASLSMKEGLRSN